MLTTLYFFWDGFSGAGSAPTPDPEPAPVAAVEASYQPLTGGGYVRPRPPETLRRRKRKKLVEQLPTVEELPLIEEPVPVGFDEAELKRAAEARRKRLILQDEAFILARGRSLAFWEELLGA